jgi:RimJ/RimL family protein N-acetyltransferase
LGESRKFEGAAEWPSGWPSGCRGRRSRRWPQPASSSPRRAQEERDDGFQAAIVRDGEIAGVAGFHRIDRVNRSTSIGYWLASRTRIVIEAAVANRRSRAIPERLGFSEEGGTRESELVGERFLDAVLYSLLAPEWEGDSRR